MSSSETNDFLKNICIRPITESDDSLIAEIIKTNLKKFHLDIPGTVYFDPEVDYLFSVKWNMCKRARKVVQVGR